MIGPAFFENMTVVKFKKKTVYRASRGIRAERLTTTRTSIPRKQCTGRAGAFVRNGSLLLAPAFQHKNTLRVVLL
jgi:hypothetical protein